MDATYSKAQECLCSVVLYEFAANDVFIRKMVDPAFHVVAVQKLIGLHFH